MVLELMMVLLTSAAHGECIVSVSNVAECFQGSQHISSCRHTPIDTSAASLTHIRQHLSPTQVEDNEMPYRHCRVGG